MFTLAYGLYDYMLSPPTKVVILLGLDGAGKSTLMEQVRSIMSRQPMSERPIPPTIVGSIQVHDRSWTLWDLGGTEQMRAMWANYAPSVDGIIYVVDIKDSHRLDESKKELMKTLTYFTEGHIPPILICLNKFDSEQDSDLRDQANALVLDEWMKGIENAVGERQLQDRLVVVDAVSAQSGRGVSATIDHFSTILHQIPPPSG